MQKKQTIRSFRRFSDTGLLEVTQTIIEKLTNNTNYQNPEPSLQAVQSAFNDFSNALVKFISVASESALDKNQKRKVLENLLSKLSVYVNSIADGKIELFESSGIPLARVPAAVGIHPAPAGLKIEDGGNPGRVRYSMIPVKRARDYKIVYSQVPAPESIEDWKGLVIGPSRGYIAGLESVKKYAFKATACSSESHRTNTYNYTQSVERVIQ